MMTGDLKRSRFSMGCGRGTGQIVHRRSGARLGPIGRRGGEGWAGCGTHRARYYLPPVEFHSQLRRR